MARRTLASTAGEKSGPEGVQGRMLALLKEGADVRRDKVRRMRQAIRSGAYENDLKLSVAIERMLRKWDL